MLTMEVALAYRDEVLTTLIEATIEIQTASGRPADGIGATSALFKDIAGFDSLNGLEVLVAVGTKLAKDLQDDILAPKDDGSALTFNDIADRIVAHIGGDDDGSA